MKIIFERFFLDWKCSPCYELYKTYTIVYPIKVYWELMDKCINFIAVYSSMQMEDKIMIILVWFSVMI